MLSGETSGIQNKVDNPRVRALIAAENPLLRRGLRLALEEGAESPFVAESASAQEALEEARRFRPQVVILDYNLPDMSLEGACNLFNESGLLVGIVAYTPSVAEQHILALLNAGALAIVLHNEPPENVRAAVLAAARRAPWLSRGVADWLLRFRRGELPQNPDLTERELDVLRLLPRGFSNDQIATALSISPATVKNHLTNIYSKLGVKGRAGAIAWAWQQGLMDQ
jgi:DNA-binding NarL/FixJ family response regulator